MIYNPLIIIPLAAWAIAQLIKFSLSAARGQMDVKYLYASGGMPSAHAAVVCALATTAAILDGVSSHIFGLCAILAAIVMYDSFGVRRSSGEQAVAINLIMESLEQRSGLQQPDKKLREVLGHKPQEVAVGAVLGVALAGIFNYDKLNWLWTFLATEPVQKEHWAYMIGFALLVAGGLLARVVLARRFKHSPARLRVLKSVFVMAQVVGWLGLVMAFGQYENVAYLSWRVASLLVIAILLIWASLLVVNLRWLPQALEAEAQEARRSKWLPLPGKKKAKKRK